MPFFVFLLSFAVAFAVEQEQPTPYDLIRPVWPLVWDTSSVDEGGTVESFSKFEPNKSKRNPVPKVGSVPYDFVPNGFVPDTLNQAFLDARNLRIGRIRINQAGYLPEDGEKQFYYISSDKKCSATYSVVDTSGKELASNGKFISSGKTTQSNWTIVAATDAATNNQDRYKAQAVGPEGTVCIGYLSEIPGLPENERLRVKVGKEYSSTFIISDRVYSMVRDATIKFYGINRSGNSESWFHKPSHTKDGGGKFVAGEAGVGEFSPREGALQGGWYDCGDHLKESQTQSYAFMVLAVMAASNPDRDDDHYDYNHGETINTDGIPDILREAKHGADFFLNAYRFADGVIDNMAVSVGNFGADHGWWGRPENQDALPASVSGRGGPHERDIRLGELGSNISGQIAAGLAILGKEYAIYDKDFADSCLFVAKKMYEFAKNLKLKQKGLGPGTYDGGKPYVFNTVADGWSSAAYNGNNESHDDLGIAAIALHYATYPDSGMLYLNDAVEDTEIGVPQEASVGFFNGGWFAWNRDGMRKSSKNTSWANAYTYTLYGFYKLLLKDSETAAKYGISENKRLIYAENVAYTLATNLSNMAGSGGNSIVLPGLYTNYSLSYGDLWYNMQTDQTWIYNRYQAGNIFEVFAYADVTKDLEGINLPQKGSQVWNSQHMKQLGINQLNYMLGVNPWDVSFLLGVGDKNDAHPHHRAANPEGKNMPGAAYVYNPPVGALFGGVTPSATGENSWVPSNRSWEDYHLSETCIDATAMFLAAGGLAVHAEDKNRAPSEVNVEIRYVGYDSAIVKITQDVRGQAMILYSESETGPFSNLALDSVPGVSHTIHLRELKNGTTYYFKVVAINARSEKYATKWLVDSTSTPFYFTTLASEPPPASIENVKVCNVTADSAEIMWFTPNGQYESKIYWDTVLTTYDQMQWNSGEENADISGIPTSFHYVKIGGLKEKTTYYYVVESNGERRSVDDNGQPLKFTTPVTQYKFEIRAYQYEFTGLDFLDLNLINKEERAFDSLTLRLYVTARPDQIEPTGGVNNQPGSCPLMIDVDICQAYDEAGFNKPCENDSEIRGLLRGAQPVRLEDTYDPSTGTYDWYFPVPLGSTTIKSSSRMRIDLGFSYGIYQNGGCETLRSTASKRMNASSGDWSWKPHIAGNSAAERVDYEGMPVLDKDFGDGDLAPIDPYIVVYRKDEFVWGYSPSYTEMTTKRAAYEMTVTLNEPFNVSNGSYINIDSTKSTMYVTGTADITEGGFVTAIWVNGTALSKEIVSAAAVYNEETKKYDLNIPVKLTIGTNKVDVTIFAGPDPECAECAENGGCAFVNRSYYVQYSKGSRTAGILTLLTEDESSVSSPAATDGSTKFYIVVKDKDNKSNTSVNALVVNSRTKDTLSVKLSRINETTGEFRSELLTARDTKDAKFPTLSFFGGDTITVIYIDAEDDEDIASQSFFANPTHPVPQYANVEDTDCNNIADKIVATFGGSSFGNGISLDSAEFAFDSTASSPAKTLMMRPSEVSGMTATFTLKESDAPKTGAPSGHATFYMTEKGTVTFEKINLTDKIAPTLTAVTILENEEPRAVQDTVKITFSEPVVLPSQSVWPLRVTDGEKEVDQSSIVVKSVSTQDNGKSYLYVIEGNLDGKVVQGKNDNHDGYLASILSTFKVSDLSMNAISDCAGPKTIHESVRPVPVSYAKISDFTGDGSPDEIYVAFESVLDEKHMLDSFDVYWGKPELYKAFNKPSEWKLDTVLGSQTVSAILSKTDSNFTTSILSYDSIVGYEDKCTGYDSTELYDSTTTPPTPYREVVLDENGNPKCISTTLSPITKKVTKTDTLWSYTLDTTGFDTIQNTYTALRIKIPAGVFQNATYGSRNGRGLIFPRKGEEGGFFDKSYTLYDDCPPIILSASWSAREMASGQMDLLAVQMSEPLDTVSEHSFYIERRRGGSKGVYLKPRTIMNDANIQKVTYMYMDNADDAVWFGDSIRLVPDTSKSYYKDLAGLYPGEETPWVPVTGIIEKVKFRVTMDEPVTKKKKSIVPYAGETLSDEEQFRLSVVGDAGERVIAQGKKKLDKVERPVSSNYEHAGPVFRIAITLPEVLDKTTFGEWKREYTVKIAAMIYNNLGTYANEVSYSFDLTEYLDFVSANNVLTLNLEWTSIDGAPRSLEGVKIGTGAYIAKFDFGATAVYVAENPDEDDSKAPIKGSSSSTVTFGYRR